MFDLKKYNKIHIIGIKGVGASALAMMLKNNNKEVVGSDVSEEFLTDVALKNAGISVVEFGESNFSEIDAVVRSVAYNVKNNKDFKKAEDMDLPIFTYPEVVASIFNKAYGVAVAGSHGKTTTTAMLAYILDKAGKNLNSIVGSKVNEWGSGEKTNDLKKDDAIFVLEADEYKKAFLKYDPKVAIITSIDYDHPDCYKTEKEYEDTFLEFARSIPEDGFIVLNKDYKNILKISESLKCKIIFYGKDNLINFELKTPGRHNLYNANAAYLVAVELGVLNKDAKKYIEEFSGTARRFDILGTKNKVTVVDDYAHHPIEIRATLSSAKEFFPNKKIIAIFQPHTYSRTKEFSGDFISAFDVADEVILTDIYSSARESIDKELSIKSMSDKIGAKSSYVEQLGDIAMFCDKYKDEDSVLLFMGAGDIWQLAKLFYEEHI